MIDEDMQKIADYEDYQISSNGEVFSTKYGYKKLMKQKTNIDGYYVVQLWKNGIGKEFRISRLVAQTFIPNPQRKRTVKHKDGNKKNNSVTNLEWSTNSENVIHAYKNGFCKGPRGESQGRSKLTTEDVATIRFLLSMYPNLKYGELADIYGVNIPNISLVVNRRNWRHI